MKETLYYVAAKIDPKDIGVEENQAGNAVTGVLNTVYFATGIIAVIVVIISAIFYTISQGDPAKTKRAKDGILYSVVGIVIILSAFVITNFVLGRFAS